MSKQSGTELSDSCVSTRAAPDHCRPRERKGSEHELHAGTDDCTCKVLPIPIKKKNHG